MLTTPVLIVGGGPVGLTASLALSQQGVRSLLVERHPGTAILPKARGINARTMEMYRQMGLETDIRAAGMPPRFGKMILWAESLAGNEVKRLTPGRGSPKNLVTSPAANCGCSQDLLEPVLRRHAEALAPGGLLFSTELTEILPTEDGVTGVLTNRVTGETGRVLAKYVIAADGAHSPLRAMIGIERTGERDIYDSVNVHCRVDLRPWVDERPAALYYIDQPDLRATFLTINGSDRWGFLVHSLSVYGFSKENLPPERCIELVRQAVGVPDLPVEVLGISFWKCSAMVADKFSAGRIFLAGDAAHETTPSGGFGLNLGVQDAHNLAWKIAAVLEGYADPSLLNSYDAERRPHATDVVKATYLNMSSLKRTERQSAPKLPRQEYLNEQGLVFGARYKSAAVLSDGSAPPRVDDPVTEYVPSATPGCRAPHVWVEHKGERLSMIDLFGRDFVLVAAPGGAAWREAASRQVTPRVVPYVIGDDVVDIDNAWMEAYGVVEGGAVLVRPDGYVAWRCRALSPKPASALADALKILLGHEAAVRAA
ncbi:FAD-dependent monooxygenase [Bradyrhizobium sp. LHD-71]|uniref:FAD-dependent monooxygenase n=1 Tax=Bradyrhizobium sp. LHD-71 TaxID=3072141 RepID=UPI00280DBA94|nr:FAD-dependent monooxygenase [Bradyrhizobium sp. LHD-71]MDQ8728300.1 FAD-dependent monooxygenase [Bradyrhizobium sp. LHD-71]